AGGSFLRCQAHEYGHATFAMADGAYGSNFYGLTGLHGLHVGAGLALLLLTLARLAAGRLVGSHSPHVAVSATVWYWHFVDVVWIFLYLIVYGWGNAGATPAEAPAPSPPAAVGENHWGWPLLRPVGPTAPPPLPLRTLWPARCCS